MCHMCDTNHQHFFLSRLSLQRSLIHCLRVDVYPMFNKLNNSLRIGFPFHILPRCRQQNNPLYNSLIGIWTQFSRKFVFYVISLELFRCLGTLPKRDISAAFSGVWNRLWWGEYLTSHTPCFVLLWSHLQRLSFWLSASAQEKQKVAMSSGTGFNNFTTVWSWFLTIQERFFFTNYCFWAFPMPAHAQAPR
jgi:hypothetical protein